MQGTRRFTEALASARLHAEAFTPKDMITRTKALGALKKAAVYIGLSLPRVALLDKLFAASEDQDWTTPGVRPIVWPSNDYLCETTGLSLTALRRHLRALIDLGLIVPTDSANGKRWGRRNETGRILVGYGFDLSPVAARYFEFRELSTLAEMRRQERRALEQEFTSLRRVIRTMTEAGRQNGFPGDWNGFDRFLEILIARRRESPLEELVNQLRDLRLLAEEAFNQASKPTKPERREAENGTHILTTTERSPCTSNETRSEADASQHQTKVAAFGRRGFRKKPGGEGGDAQAQIGPRRVVSEIEHIPLGLVNSACPEIGSFDQPASTWQELVKSAALARSWLGISADAWADACDAMGENLAAVAVAIIVEKQSRNAGEISKPGGYFRAMTARHRTGELHIIRTLYGLVGQSVH